MKEPERWLNNPDAAPPGAVDLLRAASPPRMPVPEVRARLGSELEMLANAASVLPRFPWWRVGVGAAVVALGAAGWWGLSRHDGPARVMESPPPAARAELPSIAIRHTESWTPPLPPAAESPRPAPAPRLNATRRPALRPTMPPRGAPPAIAITRSQSPVIAGDSLAREAALIEDARHTVKARPSDALKILERHKREFPAGQLSAEREYLGVVALVDLGRRQEAQERGRRLMAQYPSSTFAQRVPDLLARIAPP